MMVAFGTSTPTSITVVATNTSNLRSRNAFMVSSFSAEFIRPCNNPKRNFFNSPLPSSA
jgi:hypothetical protein